jgi:2-dehydropantoate 2-reductase
MYQNKYTISQELTIMTQHFQQVIVFGAGGIGSIMGGLLAKKNKVLLVGMANHVNTINKNGLQLMGAVKKTIRIPAVSELTKIEKNSLVLLTTKTHELPTALKQLKPLVQEDTIVVCLQNGLGSKELAEKVLKCQVVDSFTKLRGMFLEPGKVRVFTKGITLFDPTLSGKKCAAVFNHAGMKAEAPKDFGIQQWEKLCVNCIVNPLTALLNVESQELCVPELDDLRQAIFDECRTVAAKEGVAIPKRVFKGICDHIEASKTKPSMLQDILRGSKTEIDFLNGRIVQLAHRHEVPVPYNESIVSLIRALEKRIGV